ncbi:MAG TPA: dTMP kinase [Acidimicrobiales bacterium]|nr:dTMP kinase [Acidimicrobiales bacterium]
MVQPTGPSLPGRLIALEGGEASGKTTQAARLAASLGALATREPGGTALGEGLRALLLEARDLEVASRAEALVVLADRAQHVAEVVAPALAAGHWVVTDRYAGSTLAYQGYGRGLAVDELVWLSTWATGGVGADLTILLDVAVPEIDRRRAERPRHTDRLEDEEGRFHALVADGYRALAAADPVGWAVVDGSGSVEDVAARVVAVVDRRLGPLPGDTGRGTRPVGGPGAPDG